MKAALLLGLLASAAPGTAAQASVDAARQLVANGAPQKAVDMLRPIVKAEPRNADARIVLGTALALEGIRSEAIAELREAVSLRPHSAEAYNSLGMVLSHFMEISAAREAFEKAIQLDPGIARPHVNLSTILAESGDFAAAAKHLDRAIQIEGGSPAAARAYFLRAQVRREQNAMEDSRTDLETAVRLRPDFAAAWSDLGLVRRLLQDETGALQAFERAVQLDPKDSTAQLRLGSQYLRDGKTRQAIAHLRDAARTQPDSRAVLYNLERALREDGQIEEARKVEARMAQLLLQSRQASETTRQSARLNNEGVQLEKSGNVRAALAKYEAALELDPEHNGFRLNLGLALCRLGRWDEGIVQIREVVRRDPNNAKAVKALYIALDRQRRKASAEKKAPEPAR
jgi:Flp pilus assembly protein TadD